MSRSKSNHLEYLHTGIHPMASPLATTCKTSKWVINKKLCNLHRTGSDHQEYLSTGTQAALLTVIPSLSILNCLMQHVRSPLLETKTARGSHIGHLLLGPFKNFGLCMKESGGIETLLHPF